MKTAVEDTCQARMYAVAVEFWSGMGVETAARLEVDICPERMAVEGATLLSLETAVNICPGGCTRF